MLDPQRGMPLSTDVNQEKLADVTHSFVGADLAALACKAGMRAIRRVLPEIDLEVESIPTETLNKIEVNNDDFLGALVSEAVMLAIRECVLGGKAKVDAQVCEYKLENKHFEEALKTVKPTASEADIYKRFMGDKGA